MAVVIQISFERSQLDRCSHMRVQTIWSLKGPSKQYYLIVFVVKCDGNIKQALDSRSTKMLRKACEQMDES